MSIYLSASSISDFIKCSQKVLYRTTKPFPEVPLVEMTIGKIVHSVLETNWNNLEEAKREAFLLCTKENLNSLQTYKIITCINTFFDKFTWMVSENDLIEYMFKIKIHDDVYLVGKMDRIAKENIVDWKTGKISRYLGNSIQCIIYDYAYEKIFGKQAKSISLVSLQEGIASYYYRDDRYNYELFENVIPRMLKTMRNSAYERTGIFNGSCYRCSYKEGCLGEKNVVDNSTSFI